MNIGHKTILNFVNSLRAVKSSERVKLEAVIVSHAKENPGAGTRTRSVDNKNRLKARLEKKGQAGSSRDKVQWDGSIQAGEYYTIKGFSPRSGYVHLFNLGTSGTVAKLTPTELGEDNRVESERSFLLPSEKLIDLAKGRGFGVSMSAQYEHVQPERLLVIVTNEDREVNAEDLDPLFENLMRPNQTVGRKRGGIDIDCGAVSAIFEWPAESWEYGLLELELLP